MPRDARGEVGIARLSRGDERHATGRGPAELEGMTALSAARATEDEMARR
jgi:hypothetical protein